MHLKSLTLKGFKSFASATTLKFEPGICAVVGPNGSGKSNVVDALTWVMGEQGAKNLRGGKMQDVIFAGAGDRKPLGRAEVTLTIDNADGKLPIDYTEVSITRRMFRDGASEYEINGSKARLMDVQELLSDSGIGREMHIIVGQNKLGDILTSRPEERRAYIEEAAGVLKHRRRKEKAQRKLVNMQANLDRVQDLHDELKKQLGPLGRQAQAAQRAASVQADLRDARLKLAGDTLARLHQERDAAVHRAVASENKATEAEMLVETIAERQAEIDAELAELTPQADEAQLLWFDLSSLAERLSATHRIAVERADNAGHVTAYSGQDPDDLEARAVHAEEEYAELREAAEEAAEALETVREELSDRQESFEQAEAEHRAQVRAIADRREGVVRLIAAEESLAGQVRAAQEAIERQGEVIAEVKERVRAARAELDVAEETQLTIREAHEPLREQHLRLTAESQAAETRLEQLRDTQREHERAVASLRARIETLEENQPKAVAGEVLDGDFERLSNLVSPTDSRYARALARALGPHAEALAGELDDASVELLAEASRAIVVERGAHGSEWRLDVNLPDGCSWLLDNVTIDTTIRVPITRLLVDVVLAPSYRDARALVASDPRVRAVTEDGIVVGEGWIEVGEGAPGAVEVSASIADAQAQLEIAEAELQELAGTLEGARQAADEARVRAAGATSALRDNEAQLKAADTNYQRAVKQVEVVEKELGKTVDRASGAEARLADLNKQHAEARDRLARVDDEDQPNEASTAERDAALDALNRTRALEVEAQMAARSAQEKAASHAGKSEALRRQAAHEREAKARHERAMRARAAAGELARAVARHAEALIERTEDALGRATHRRDELSVRKNQAQARAGQVKSELSAARTQLSRLKDAAHQAQIARSEALVRVEESELKLSEQLGLPAEDIVRDYAPTEDFDRAAETARLKRAEKDLRSLGKVNPLALEEYKALEERYQFLAEQLADVTKARSDLEGVIEDVDKQILELFSAAWRDVEAEFPKVFDTLFPGGEGRLVLTDPDDILATGIEVEARPPGKKVKRLSLLSGGEKSLTALAMLVAIFRARPSPFYVMDEVEAALDDVNLRRLIALFEELRTDSQLIVITHQKPTMDVANVLYGVTMRGDGVTRVLSQRMSPAGQPPASLNTVE